jgi:hypothetical protein
VSGTNVYELYGRRVRSNVELGPCVAETGAVDLDLRLEPATGARIGSDVPRGTPIAGVPGQPFNVAVVQDDEGYLLRARDLVDVRFNENLDRAVCYPGPGVCAEHLRDLSTTIMSAWMAMCGSAVFHGSAVAGVPGLAVGKVVALLGSSFAGKSTWAALLWTMGAQFVTDDALPIGNHQGTLVVEGGCPELRLRKFEPDPWPAMGALPHRLTVDGRVAVLAGSPIAGLLPLLCAVVLEPTEHARRPALERLNPFDSLIKLAGSHRTAGLRLKRAQVAHFERASEVALSVPMFVLNVPLGPPQPAWAGSLVGELRSRLEYS